MRKWKKRHPAAYVWTMGGTLQTPPLASVRNSIWNLALKMQALLYDTLSRSSVISWHQVILGKFLEFVSGGHLSPWVDEKQAVPALSLLGDFKWAFSVRFQHLYNTVTGMWGQLRWDKKKNSQTTVCSKSFLCCTLFALLWGTLISSQKATDMNRLRSI